MWKKIDNFSKYSVDENGNVRNDTTDKLIVGDTNNCGYKRVSIVNDEGKCKHQFRHRLVANAFIPNPKNLKEIDHIDANKNNNSVSNLRWVTRNENEKNAHVTGRKPYRPIVVQFDDGRVRGFNVQTALARYLGVTKRTVMNWNQGKNQGYKRHGIKRLI